jgi:opacity protein-like surface antigen
MSIFAGRLTLAVVLAALSLGGRTAHAQVAAVPYLGFDGSDAQGGGFSVTRTNFPNSWFVGGGGIGLNGINQASAFGNSLYYEGVQVGYNFQNGLPFKIFAGFDTLKYNTGIGSPFAPFDTTSGTLPGYRAHAGVEFQPAPNLSLSLGVGYTQQSGRLDSEINSPPGASPFGPSGRR